MMWLLAIALIFVVIVSSVLLISYFFGKNGYKPLSDEEATKRIASKYRMENASRIVKRWRKMAELFGYGGVIVWAKGNSRNRIVFWIPRLVPESTNKSAEEQRKLVSDLGWRQGFPTNYLSFGDADMLRQLLCGYYESTKERTLGYDSWVRTDTRIVDVDGLMVALGWGDGTVSCGVYYTEKERYTFLGVFALRVEELN